MYVLYVSTYVCKCVFEVCMHVCIMCIYVCISICIYMYEAMDPSLRKLLADLWMRCVCMSVLYVST